MEARHPMGVVTSRTRLTPELLRAWERRYRAVSPWRSESGRRLYSDADIEKLQLLKRLVDAGRRISDVAAFDLDRLRDLDQQDRTARLEDTQRRSPSPAPVDADARDLLARALGAVEALDRRALEGVLGEGTVALSPVRLREALVLPLMKHIGDAWHTGGLRIVHEHMASSVIHAFLYAMQQKRPGSAQAPRLLAATLPGSRHELGALLAASVAAERGWDVTYLGPDLPAAEIAAAVHARQARAVAISAVFADDAALLQRELRWLRELAGEGVELFAGGEAARTQRGLLDELGIHFTASLLEFGEQLDGAR
ncbi:MAG: MerR family transcriptional regulator [Candidatus Krumholzibacteriia bacterium]|nr:MerR family transcriptional regulator [bacterium]MCB9513583.1 MerR family transcriptional regulator [Candidatus Latescibacterota bacterium]MCB9515570.1 MerR family transcriptional regulator [Candidatus Latescibacterota bacterium]